MNPATLTLARKVVTLQNGRSIDINSGVLLSVRASGSGSSGTIWFGSQTRKFTSTDSPAVLVVGWPSISVTDSQGAVYIPTGAIREFYAAATGTGTIIEMAVNPTGTDYQNLPVSETLAAVRTAYDAVAAASGGGSTTFASYTAAGTNQATATPTTTGEIRITGGAVSTGIVLDGATGGEQRKIYNATTTLKFIYPAVGEFIDPSAVNIPITLGPGEGIFLSSNLNAHWSRYENEDHQFVAGSGTVQLGGQVNVGVQDVTITTAGVGNTAVTLPLGTVGYRITVSNTTASNVRLYPFTGDQITANGANNFINFQAGRQVELIMDVAGTWLFAQSQFETIATSTINTPTTGGTTALADPVAGNNATFSNQGNAMQRGLLLFQAAGVATPAGVQGDGVQISSNIYNIETCATDLDSATLTAISDIVLVKNSGVAIAAVYCPSGQTMDGVSNGFASIPPGESYLFYQSITASQWISMPFGETGQSLTATPAGTQGTSVKVRGSVVTLATVATVLDGATIDNTSGIKEFILLNNAGVSASLFPPVGGTIDGGAANAAFVVPRSATFLLTTTNGLDYFVKLLPGATQVATANTGSTQATGEPIVSPFVNCTVVATAGDSYTIKNYSPRRFAIWNRDAADALDLFPTVGGTIDGGAADVAFSIPAGVGFSVSSIDGQAWLVELLENSVQSATASATSDQAGGTQVVSTSVNCTTVATAGDSYTIRAWSPRNFQIWNRDSAESLDLFPPVGGTIDGAAANIAFAIPAGVGFKVYSNDGITWLVQLLDGSVQSATASATSDQAGGTAIVSPTVNCTTVATAGDSYTLRAWSPRSVAFWNRDSADSADVFPPVGGTINGAAANVAFAVAAGVGFRFVSNDGITFLVELLPNSLQSGTASASSDQAGGTPIVSTAVVATVVGTAGDSFTIQTYSPRNFTIQNRDAAESLDLFPPVGGTIDGGAVDAAIAIAGAANLTRELFSNDGITWFSNAAIL